MVEQTNERTDGGTNKWTDKQMHSPAIQQDIAPYGAAAQKALPLSIKKQNRMTTGFRVNKRQPKFCSQDPSGFSTSNK